MAAKKPPKKYPPHLTAAMKSQIDWLTGRIHVGTPDAEVAEDVRRRCKAWPPGLCEEAAEYAVKSHHANLGLYQDVMSGNLGRGTRSNPRRAKFPVGSKIRVSEGAGVQSRQTGTVVKPVLDHRGIAKVDGAYNRFDPKREVMYQRDDNGKLETMFMNYLTLENPSAPRRKMRPYGNTAASKRSMRPYGNPAQVGSARRIRRNGADIGRIYVADLAAYNDGVLAGEWITPSNDAAEVAEQIQQVLVNVKRKGHPVAEEAAIHDYEDFPDLGEYPSAEKIAKTVQGLEQIAESSNPDALHALIESETQYAEDIDSALEYMENNFAGEFDNAEQEFVYSLVEDGVAGDDFKNRYFDAEAFGRDIRMDLDEEGEDSWAADLTDEQLGEHYIDDVFGGMEHMDPKTVNMYFDDQAAYWSMKNGGEILVLRKNSKDFVFWNQ